MTDTGKFTPETDAHGSAIGESRPVPFATRPVLQGSLGMVAAGHYLASAIGLGLSLADRDTPTVVLDGDGNLLMNLGILPLVAALQPRRFVHIVFDNEVYGSTGSQRSISAEIRLDRLAVAALCPDPRLSLDEADERRQALGKLDSC